MPKRRRPLDRWHRASETDAVENLTYGGRFTLGVGIGWRGDEYEFMGVEFECRGRRADEAIRPLHR